VHLLPLTYDADIKIKFIQTDLQVSPNTAIRYLEELVKEKILIKHKIGRENFYENRALFRLLSGN
jgi:Fic family protein